MKKKIKKTKKDYLGTLRIPTPPPGHNHGDKRKYDRKLEKLKQREEESNDE